MVLYERDLHLYTACILRTYCLREKWAESTEGSLACSTNRKLFSNVTGIGMYTLLYMKQITNADLLWSTGLSTQYSVMTCRRKEAERVGISSVAQSCPTRWDPMDCSMPGFPVHHLPELAPTQVHWVGDATQLSHPLLSPSAPVFSVTQHQGLF